MPKGCYPKSFSTEARVDGEKIQVFVLSCSCFKVKDPTHTGQMKFKSKTARDREKAKHE